MNRKTILSLGVLTLVFLAGMSGISKRNAASPSKDAGAPMSRSSFFFNTFVTVTVYDSNDTTILDDTMAICKEYESIFSKTLEGSELYRINHRAENEQTLTVSDPMAELLEKGLFYSELSGGAFDITIEPLSSLWDFTAEDPAVPAEAEILAAVPRVGYEGVLLEGNTLTFSSPDTTIDLGAIAKGYIADEIKAYLTKAGVKSALINLGGNVLCVGSLPGGNPFRVGLQLPFADRSETFETLLIDGKSVVVSGVYERNFVEDGKNYHHLLNPKDGYPYDNGLLSVTVVSEKSVDGDGLSTTLFSLGPEKGLALANSLDGVYACFIDEDYNVSYSKGFRDFIMEGTEKLSP